MVTENKRRSTTKKPKKVNNLRYAEYYDMQETFDGLYAKAAKGETFDSLMDLIFSKDNILLAYRNIKGNGGSVTPGTDGLTIGLLRNAARKRWFRRYETLPRITAHGLYGEKKFQSKVTQARPVRWVFHVSGTG